MNKFIFTFRDFFINRRKRDYLITFGTEMFVFLSGLMLYRFASVFLQNNDFSVYALCRRTISLLIPLLVLGMGVGIPRYVAYAVANKNNTDEKEFFITGLLTSLLFTFLFVILHLCFSSFFSHLYFGSEAYTHLIFPICVAVFALVMHSLVYSYYRGKMNFVVGNLLQFINLGVIPFFVFYIFRNLFYILLLTGLFNILITIIFVIPVFLKIQSYAFNFSKKLNILLNYGIQRLPGDFALSALLSLPAYFVTHTQGVEIAGYVAFGISLITMAGSFFAPLSLILLPQISQLLAEKKYLLIRKDVKRIIIITFVLTMVGIIVYESFSEYILMLYLTNYSNELLLITRIVFIGSIGYTMYVSLRSVLDAYYIKAINTRNIIISFCLFLLISVFVLKCETYLYILIAFIISLIFLGFITYFESEKLIKKLIHQQKETL